MADETTVDPRKEGEFPSRVEGVREVSGPEPPSEVDAGVVDPAQASGIRAVDAHAKAVELLADVSGRIKQSLPAVYERVVAMMTEREITERVVMLEAAITKRGKLLSELRKIEKPDNETFDADGKPLGGTYSKSRVEELRKQREQIQKLENAIEKALSGNDFTKLKEQKS